MIHGAGAEKVVVIGSGIGGLSSGIMLAQLGFHVTLLEKNPHPGGMIRSYVRQGVHCNVGLHYLGGLDDGQVLRRCFDFLGITPALPLVRMGEDGPVDRYLFVNEGLGVDAFDVPCGFDAYEANLRSTFPSQHRQIDALMGMLRHCARQFDHLDFLYADVPTKSWFEQSEALGSVFDRLGCCPALRAVFGLPAVLVGVPPAQCPVLYHTMALASYLASAWRVQSNGAQIADACVRRFTGLGGLVRTGEAVVGIKVADGGIRGVTLASGEHLDADLLVSTLHPRATLELLPTASVKPSYRRRIQGLTDTGGMIAVHAMVPASHHPALAHNLFAVETDSAGDARDLIYIQLRPCERPEYNLLSLITSGHMDLWESWRHTVSGQRGQEYLQAKKTFAHHLIARAEQSVGPFRELQLLDVSTPLTIRDWVGSPNGSAYGVMRSTKQLLSASLLNRTSLKGLFLAGQSVLSPGVLGTVLGSLATVQFIIGPERFRQEVRI